MRLSKIIFLTYCMSTAVPLQAQLQPSAQADSAAAGNRSGSVATLQSDLARTSQDQELLGGKITAVRNPLEAMLAEVAALTIRTPDEKPPDPAKPKTPQRVPFRPPLERLVEKEDVTIICQEGRLSILDFDALNAAIRNASPSGGESVNIDIPGSDFRVVAKNLNSPAFSGTVERKSGSQYQGESLEEGQRPNSRIQQALNKHGPGEFVIDFVVYPDSYDVFRKIRSFVWDKNYEAGWHPMEAGEGLKLGRSAGPAMSGVQ